MNAPLARRLLAEFLGSAFLAAVVIGSGIAAARLSPGDIGLQLFENAAATAAGLFTIILMFGPVSGAHFNPVVSLVDASFGGLRWREAFAYIPAQVAGCIAGRSPRTGCSRLPPISISTKHRASEAHLLAEVVATLGLLLVIFSFARTRRGSIAPAAVGAYIGAAYFFTSSTSFANPAITRRPDVLRHLRRDRARLGTGASSSPSCVGGVVAIGVIRVLYPGHHAGRGRRGHGPARGGLRRLAAGGLHSLFTGSGGTGRTFGSMPITDPTERLGLSIPYDWWPAAPILKEIEAAGFRFVQVPSPPPSVLVSPRDAIRHAAGSPRRWERRVFIPSCTAPGRFAPGPAKATSPSRD